MADSGHHEERRYSAIVLSHPRLQTPGDLVSAVGPMAGHPRAIDQLRDGVSQVELMHDSVLYPGLSASTARELRRGKIAGKWAYAHESYIATSMSAAQDPTLIVAAPYKVLLRRLLTELAKNVESPTVQYVKIDMSSAFEFLSHQQPGFDVIKIRAQLPNDPLVSLVALEGTAPLDSDTWVQMRDETSPYGLTIRYVHRGQGVRVHLDRVGNANWYQTNEKCAPAACTLLARLGSHLGRKTTNSPLSAKSRTLADEEEPDASA
jgi:hypothetical protein